MKTHGILGGSLAAFAALASAQSTKIYGYENIRRVIQRQGRRYDSSGSIADKPHKHEREIARRLRQRKRLHQKYMLNGGFSRRGNEVGPVA